MGGQYELIGSVFCAELGYRLRPELQNDYVEAAGGPVHCIGIDILTFVTLIAVQILLILKVAINFIYL